MKPRIVCLVFALAVLTWAQSSGVRDGCQAGGASGTAYACNYTVSPGLIVGHLYWFRADVANTGADPTIAFNGGAAVTIKKVQGGVTTALVGNDIRAGQYVLMTYDGVNMQMLSQLGNAPTAGSGDFSTNTTASTDGEMVRFSGTGGKTGQRSNTLNGIMKLTNGVPSAATAGTDYMTPSTPVQATQLPSGLPQCSKYTIAYTALTAATTTQNVNIFTVPAQGKITGLTIKEGTQFTCTGGCTGISSLTISLGRSATETEYAPAWSLMQAVSNTNMFDDGGHYSATWASHQVVARFTVTNASPGNLGTGSATRLTAGSVDIWACVVTLP